MTTTATHCTSLHISTRTRNLSPTIDRPLTKQCEVVFPIGNNKKSLRERTWYNHIKKLLANCRQLGCYLLLSGSNQLREARSGRTGISFLCEPLASAKDVHGCRSKQFMKTELLASDVAYATHLTGSYALDNRPFKTSSHGIQRSKLRGLLALTSFV